MQVITKCGRCGRPCSKNRPYGAGCQRRVNRAAQVLECSGKPLALKVAAALRAGNVSVVKPGKVWRIVGRTGEYLCAPNTCTCPGATYNPTANSCYHSWVAAILAVK